MKRLLVTLSILFAVGLLFSSTATAKRTSLNLKDARQMDRFLMDTLQDLIRLNSLTGQALLRTERDRNLGSVLHKIRINLNAKAMLRIVKAFAYFEGVLNKKIPTLTATSKRSTRWMIAALKKAAEQTQKDSDAGKWSVLKAKAPVPFPRWKTSKPLTAGQRKVLVGLVDAYGPSLEILSYYRLMQLVKRVNKESKTLGRFLNQLNRQKNRFKVLAIAYPKAAGSLRMMAYHLALTIRCGALQLRMKKVKGGKRTVYGMRYNSRKKQLNKSLSKANSAFSSLWKSAIDER